MHAFAPNAHTLTKNTTIHINVIRLKQTSRNKTHIPAISHVIYSHFHRVFELFSSLNVHQFHVNPSVCFSFCTKCKLIFMCRHLYLLLRLSRFFFAFGLKSLDFLLFVLAFVLCMCVFLFGQQLVSINRKRAFFYAIKIRSFRQSDMDIPIKIIDNKTETHTQTVQNLSKYLLYYVHNAFHVPNTTSFKIYYHVSVRLNFALRHT